MHQYEAIAQRKRLLQEENAPLVLENEQIRKKNEELVHEREQLQVRPMRKTAM